jgi:protein-disulfide isomerase
MTQAQGAAILEELRRIEVVLSTRTADAPSSPALGASGQFRMRLQPEWRALGNDAAPLVVLEFTDLQCPVCRRFHKDTFARLKTDYIDTGKVRFITRDFPLPMHPFAQDAANAVRCAGAQGKFWSFRDAVLSVDDPPTPQLLATNAQKLGLDLASFTRCEQTGQFEKEIKKDEDDAASAGVNGTPTFLIGKIMDGWVMGTMLRGNRPYPVFQSLLDSLIDSTRADVLERQGK